MRDTARPTSQPLSLTRLLTNLNIPSRLQPVAERSFSRSTWAYRLQLAGVIGRATESKDIAQRILGKLDPAKPAAAAKQIAAARWVMLTNLGSVPSKIDAALRLVQRGLRKAQARRPKTKALPMTKAIVRHLVSRSTLDLGERCALQLAFTTASRVDDIMKLLQRSFLPHGKHGLVIMWDVSKANWSGERRSDHQQVVENAGWLRKALLGPKPPAFPLSTTARLNKILAQIKPTSDYVQRWRAMDPANKIREHFTLHSLKRGKAAELWERAARGDVTIPTLLHTLKHKSLEASLAYAPSPALAAAAVTRSLANTQSRRSSARVMPVASKTL